MSTSADAHDPSVGVRRRHLPGFAREGRSERLPPHLSCHLDAAPELGPLLVLGQQVALLRAGEAALGRQAELIEGANFAASSMRRLSWSLLSSAPVFEVMTPSTTCLPLGSKRSGSKPPARSVSYSMK